MAQLLVERGHAGRRRNRFPNRGLQRSQRLRHGDEDWDRLLPKRRFRPDFSENLAPLRRYLRAQVGRHWDTVYAEIRSHLNANSAVQLHILQHLYDDLAVVVRREDDGRLWYQHPWAGYRPLDVPYGPRLYVCPESGCIRSVRRRWRQQPKPAPTTIPGADDRHDYRLLDGQWYACSWGRDERGAPLLLHKRQLGRKHLKALGLRV